MHVMRMVCCGAEWVGPDRAHCCRRTRGCGRVFDDADLWDAHRRRETCVHPQELGLVQTRNGIWLRSAPLTARSTAVTRPTRRRRSS